jgi:hypothetical protein
MCYAIGKPVLLISTLKQIEQRPGAIVILGAPGSGKSVLADGIVNELGFALTVNDEGLGPANAEIITIQSLASPMGLELVTNASIVFVLSDDAALAKYLDERLENPDDKFPHQIYWYDPTGGNDHLRLPDWLLSMKQSRLEKERRSGFCIIRENSGEQTC